MRLNDKEPKKCMVMNCKNTHDKGSFVGDVCYPCYQFITTGDGKYSQVYRNATTGISKILHTMTRDLNNEMVHFSPDEIDLLTTSIGLRK